MIVVEKKPVPLYEVECSECHSKIQYKKSEVIGCRIYCPVCGVYLWADTTTPIDKEEEETNVPIYPYRKEHFAEIFANDKKEITGLIMGEEKIFDMNANCSWKISKILTDYTLEPDSHKYVVVVLEPKEAN